jgi:8-oxo-dGTP diphosphatase
LNWLWEPFGMGGPDHSGFREVDGALQFGAREFGAAYPTRRGAHGIACNGEGLIALSRIERADGGIEYDLPGGGVDPGETDEAALVREFMEETGLPVRAGRFVTRVKQYWRTDRDETRNADFQIFEVAVTGAASQPSEPDHSLVWMAPQDAISAVRHEAQAFALRTFLARRGA